MREAVIVSTARTPIGKAYRGAFNNTDAASLGGHAIREAVKRAGVEPGEIDDVVMCAALQKGATASNLARNCAVAADRTRVAYGKRDAARVDLGGRQPIKTTQTQNRT